MAHNFSVNRGVDSKIKLQPINPGAIWIAEDGQYICLDSRDGLKRIQITDVIDLSVESPTGYFPNKIYIQGNQLKKYDKDKNDLVVISSLESDIVEDDNNAFTYTSQTEATLANTSNPLKGTIVIDKNGDVGVTTSSSATTITVAVIANNSFKNTIIGYDFYIDGNYSGIEVGTFEQPYKSLITLLSTQSNELQNSAYKTIHIKANSINIGTSISNVKNTTIIFEDISKKSKLEIQNCDSLFIKGLYVNNLTISDSSIELQDVNIDNASVNTTSINLTNANITQTLTADNCNITINNTNISTFTCINECNVNMYNSNILTKLNNTTGELLQLFDTNICDLDVSANIVRLNSGSLTGSLATIKATEINLGTFNFNGIEPTLNGTVKNDSGLSSIQVYDKETGRGYGIPETPNLKSHLDSIGNKLKKIDDKLSETNSSVDAFITKDTFTSQNDLSGEFRIGDVMTYVNEASTNLIFNHELIGTNFEVKNEYDYESINVVGVVNYYDDLPTNTTTDDVYSVTYDENQNTLNKLYKFDGLTWVELETYEYLYYYFSLDNASYYAKFNDEIMLLNYVNIAEDTGLPITNDAYLTIKVYSVQNNRIIGKIKRTTLIDAIKSNISSLAAIELTDEQINTILENYLLKIQTTSIFNQVIKVSHKDRLIKLSNGWDKLSGSVDSADGNYHIVPTYTSLFQIENDNTREIGTLAYVQDEDMVYQWKYTDDTKTVKDWVEFSSGTGTNGSRFATLQYCNPSNKTHPYIKYNYTMQVPLIYYNNEEEIQLNYYVSTTISGTVTYNLYKEVSGTRTLISTGGLQKGEHSLTVTKEQIGDTTAEYQIEAFSSEGRIYVTDADGNELVNYLRYTINAGTIILKTNFEQSNIYLLDENNPQNNENININLELKMDSGITCKKLALEIRDLNNNIIQLIDDNEILSDELIIRENFYMASYKTTIDNLLTARLPHIVDGDYKLHFYAVYTINESDRNFDLYQTLHLMLANKINLQNVVLDSSSIHSYVSPAFTASMLSTVNTPSMECYYYLYQDTDNDVPDFTNVTNPQLIATDSKWIKVDLGTKTANYKTVTEFLAFTNKISTTGEYKLAFIIKQTLSGSSYLSNCISEIPIQITISNDSAQEPVTNTVGDECLIMNFDMQRTADEDITSSYWNSSVGNYQIKFSGVVNTDTIGTNVRESVAEENNNLSAVNDRYVRLFGDAKGVIITTDSNGNETNYQAFKEQDTVNNGFTIEILFRANYTGDIHTAVMKLAGQVGLNIKYDEIEASIIANSFGFDLVENKWTHIMLVVDNNKKPADYNEIITTSSAYTNVAHCAIYINGVIAKTIPCPTGFNINVYNAPAIDSSITFNVNEYDEKEVFGLTDLKVFRLYNRRLTPEEILRNYHSCIPDQSIRESEIKRNQLSEFSEITEIYFIRNTDEVKDASGKVLNPTNNPGRKDSVKNTTFNDLNIITDKDTSKKRCVNCSVLIVRLDATGKKEYIFYKNVDILLQGTSTLRYPIKNYRVRYYKEDGTGKKLKVEFENPSDGIEVNLDGENTFKTKWKPEYQYTMKCDYMESSHMNNTGIARYINDNIYKNVGEGDELRLTPSQEIDDSYRIVIDGFPSVLYIIDDKNSANSVFELINNGNYTDSDITNIKSMNTCKLMGTYMYNLDKEANENYGFLHEDESGEVTFPYLQSLEITANDDMSSGAFNKYTGTNIDADGNVYKSEQEFYSKSFEARCVYDELDVVDESLVSSAIFIEGDEEVEYDMVQIVDGEFVIPGVGVYAMNDDGIINTINNLNDNSYNRTGTLTGKYRKSYNEDFICYNGIAQCINFINANSGNSFKNLANKFLDLRYCIDYYILTMTFGMVDNLGKNLMINSWNYRTDNNGNIIPIDPKFIDPNDISATTELATKWYPTFYDMDTCLGLNNVGTEYIDADAEMQIDYLCGYVNKGIFDPNTNTELDLNYKANVDANPDYDPFDYLYPQYSNWLNYFTVNGQMISKQSAYRYPTELVEMMIKLHYDESLMIDAGLNSDIINTLIGEKQRIESEISSNSSYKYYWPTQFIITDKNGQGIESATIENANFVRLTWVVFDLNKQEITVPPEFETKRFKSYNTTSSKLWSKIASIYDVDIYERYKYLRLNGLDSNTIINKLRTFSSDIIPKAYYNSNAISKYLLADYGAYDATTIMKMCNGDRKIKLEKWLKDRFNFVDTIIQSNSIAFPGSEANKSLIIYPNTTSVVSSDFYITTFTPQYVTVQTDQTGIIRQYVNENSQDNENFMGRKFTKMFNQGKVEVIYCANNISSLISLDTLNPRDTISLANFTKAKELIIAENGINSAINNIIFVDTSIERTEDHHFNRVVIHSSSITSLDLSTMPFIEELDLSNCTALANLTLAENARIKTIKLRNCKSLNSLRMVGLFQLSNIDFTGCNKLNELAIINTPQLLNINLSGLPLTKLTVNEIGFNELTLDSLKNVTTIAIEDANIKTFKLTNSSMASGTTTLDLSNCPKLTTIDVRGTTGVTTLILPKNTNTETKTLGIAGCSDLSCIGFADEDESVENTRQSNTFNFKYYYQSQTNDIEKTRDLDFLGDPKYGAKFYQTMATTITNLYTNSVTKYMFYHASSLKTINYSYIATSGDTIYRIFDTTKIQEFNNTTLSFPYATNAALCFRSSIISKQAFKKVIDACTQLTTIERICENTTFINNDRILDTSWFKENPITNMASAFRNTNITAITADEFLKTKNLDETSNNTKRKTTMMFAECTSLTSVPPRLLQSNGPDGFGEIRAMFYNCTSLENPVIINNLTGLTDVRGLYMACTKLSINMNTFKTQLSEDPHFLKYFAGEIVSGSDINDFIYSSIYKLSNITKADAMFYNCDKLIGETITETTGSGIINNESCIPEDLFINNASLTSAKSMFYGCDGLTTILPNRLFNNSTIKYVEGFFTLSNISGTIKNTLFEGCDNLERLGPDTFNDSYSQNSMTDRDKRNNLTYNLDIVTNNDGYEVTIKGYTGGFFQRTQIKEYEPKLLYPLKKLTHANCLFSGKSNPDIDVNENGIQIDSYYFEGCTNRNNTGYSIDSTIFAENSNLEQAAFAFSHNKGIILPIHPNVLVPENGFNHDKLKRIDGMFEECSNIDTRRDDIELSRIIKLSHLTNLEGCSGLFSGCIYYKINANCEDSTNEFYNEDINRIFMNMNNLKYTSFMFNRCGLTAEFKNDEIFKSIKLEYVQHMFNQIYNKNNELIKYAMKSLSETEVSDLPINYLGNDTETELYHHLNYNIRSNIIGKIPRYLFRDKIKLVNASYFFAGTGISGFIPKTIFDIPNNHELRNFNYSNFIFSIYDSNEGTFINKDNVYFYEDPNGLYYTIGLDDITQRIQMNLWSDGITATRYSMYEGFQYTEDVIIQTTAWKTKFTELKNISYMFAYCTNLRNGDPVYEGNEFDDNIVDELTSLTIKEKQITTPFKYNGYVITLDEDIINDTNIKKYVVSDLENVFREYNPVTDANKNKYILNNECLELFDAATILNDEPDGIIVNLPKVYAVHPNTLIFLSAVTNVNGLFEGCNELQGCISDVMFNRNKQLIYASRVFANCANVYGFIDNSGTNQIVSLFTHNFSTITNISGFFYNCFMLGAFGKQKYLSQIGLDKYGSTSAYVKEATMISSKYVNGFLVYIENGLYLTKKLTNVIQLFYNCIDVTGGIPADVLTDSKYCSITQDNRISMFFNCKSMDTYDEYLDKPERVQ